MPKEVQQISVAGAPAPKGAYSQVVRAGDLLFISGQGAIDPRTGEFCFGDISSETRLVLQNIQAVLEEYGASLRNVVKCSVFLANASDFSVMNEVYGDFFAGHAPARTTVQATLVEPDMKIEIDCIAYFPVVADTN